MSESALAPSAPRAHESPTTVLAKSILLLLLVLAWFDPPLPSALPAWMGGAVDLLVLRDASPSLRRINSSQQETALARAVATLARGSRVATVVFDGESELVRPLAAATNWQWPQADAPGTHASVQGATRNDAHRRAGGLSAAIDTALALAEPGRATRMLLRGDGSGTIDEQPLQVRAALERARAARLTVQWLDESEEAALPGVWIDDLAIPRNAAPGAHIPVTVTVGRHGLSTGQLRLSIDGQLSSQIPLPLDGSQLWWLSPLAPGNHEVSVQVSAAGDALSTDNSTSALVRVPGPGEVLYITRRGPPPPLARSLAAGGWPLGQFTPQRLAEGLRRQPALVVLDDVAARDIPAPAMAALTRAVRNDGVGLLVLGGPNAFATGGYRGSALEALLPVIAEPAAPDAPLAALFLVDTSGSMGRDSRGTSALAMARRAVLETADSLAPGDWSGVYAFDVVLRRVLPLAPSARPARDALAALATRASGGTHLADALRAAVNDLAASKLDRRLLVVVTDARLDPDDDLTAVQQRVKEAAIQVLVLVVGDAPVTAALRTLAATGAGNGANTVLRVGDVAQLPRVMQREMDRRRGPPQIGPLRPVAMLTAPFMDPVADWPRLGGFAHTRARKSARIFLQTATGTPLLAAHDAGAGRVAVLPGGLSGWAGEWVRWVRFGELAGGLTQWLSMPTSSARLQLQLHEEHAALRIQLDARGLDGDWLREIPASLQLSTAGGVRQVALTRTAPGRFEAQLNSPPPGRYALTARADEASLQQVRLHKPPAQSRRARHQVLTAALADGLVTRSTDVEQLQLTGKGSLRPWLLALVAVLYPLLLACGPLRIRLALFRDHYRS